MNHPADGVGQPTVNSLIELNFAFMAAIVKAAHENPARACLLFGLDAETLDKFMALSPIQTAQFLMSMGEEALFAPRADLAQLLNAPKSVVGLLAATAERLPAQAHHT